MTQYTRSVIPGRAQPDDRPLDRELDRMVFGRQQGERAAVSEPDAPAPRVSSRKAAPVSMDDDDAPPEHLFTERAPRERRRATRRKTDYVPLTEDANQKAADASKRGPLILVVTLVVIGVFGAVVWNAYSSGLRAPDGGPTPELASAGPFKTRPAADASKPADIDASVFERVEKTPAPAVTQEVRPETVQEPRPEPVKADAAKLEPVKPAPGKVETPAPTSVKAVTPAAEKPAPTPVAATPVPKPVAVAAAAPVAAKPAKPVEARAKPAAAPTATADAATPAPPALEGAGAYHPAFAATGAYVVQLAAPSTEAAAHAEWMRRAKAAPALLTSAEKLVVKADVNGKTVYRLRAGSFATSADADAFCAAIKASGGACFTAKK